MKVEYQVFSGSDFVKANVVGKVDFEASTKAFAALAGDPAFPRNQRILLDLRECDCDMSITDVYYLVRAIAREREKFTGRMAIVVAETEAQKLAGFMETTAGNVGLQVRAFGAPDAAKAWLDGEEHDGSETRTLVTD